MPHVYAYLTGFAEFIENFTTKNDDVFIVGFPRSGEFDSSKGMITRSKKRKNNFSQTIS